MATPLRKVLRIEFAPRRAKPLPGPTMEGTQPNRHRSDATPKGQKLQAEYRLNPLPHQIAVKEFEHGLFVRDRLVAGDDSGDDHIAAAVEGKRQHRFRRWGANLIAAAAAFHPVHRNGPAGSECRSFVTDEIEIADAVKFFIVSHSGLTIAETDFRPQIEIDRNPAIGRLALKSPPPSPLVDGERPCAFGPDRPIVRRQETSILQRHGGKEDRVAANPDDEHGGNACDPLAHDRFLEPVAVTANLLFAIMVELTPPIDVRRTRR
jgi:hypothetical protein